MNVDKQHVLQQLCSVSVDFQQGLEGVLRDPGFGRNRARDSGIQEKSSRDS